MHFWNPGKWGILLLCAVLLTGCSTGEENPEEPITPEITESADTQDTSRTEPESKTEAPVPETVPPQPEPPDGETLARAIAVLPDSEALRQADIADTVTAEALASLSPEQRTALGEAIETCASLTELRIAFRQITGYTFHAWRDVRAAEPSPETESGYTATPYTDGTATLMFTGDVCLADDWYNMVNYHQRGSDIANNITEALRGYLAGADVTLMNCECTLSDRGTPMANKKYTFRGKPENAEIFARLGVDIVSLANNHAHDYGRDAFFDTMDALEAAGVAHVGAGETLAEAMEYRSFIADGMKIAYVAASNAEKFRLTPGATDTSPGILLMYEESNMLAAIDRAAREADVVVAYVHWGTENSKKVNANQQQLRDQFIAHGCDVIVGSHPHVLQPWEIRDGVPVVYSLGNFWFNMETLDTAAASVEVSLTPVGVSAACTLYACVQSGGVTGLAGE